MKFSIALTICCFAYVVKAQTISQNIPSQLNARNRYLFYLHGGIVQDMGANAVSADYGPYLYFAILDSLKHHGFHVISEVRPKGTEVEVYAKKVASQIDTLLSKGISPKNITVVGASLGAYITLEVSHLLSNSKINFVVLAVCNGYNIKFYSKYKERLCGNFLSIYEASDQKLSCDKLLLERNCKSGYKEIKLTMGNGHGFIFKPYPEWTLPMVEWINAKRND